MTGASKSTTFKTWKIQTLNSMTYQDGGNLENITCKLISKKKTNDFSVAEGINTDNDREILRKNISKIWYDTK